MKWGNHPGNSLAEISKSSSDLRIHGEKWCENWNYWRDSVLMEGVVRVAIWLNGALGGLMTTPSNYESRILIPKLLKQNTDKGFSLQGKKGHLPKNHLLETMARCLLPVFLQISPNYDEEPRRPLNWNMDQSAISIWTAFLGEFWQGLH